MQRLKGILFIVSGAMLWGATGPLMEWLLNHTSLTVSFMLTIRLSVAGMILLTYLLLTGKNIFGIWQHKLWGRQLIVFGIVGMLGVQFAFVAAIHESNAVLATLLQFLAPIFVVAYVSLSLKKWPPKYQVIGIIGTLMGLFLLLTNASFDSLLISPKALLWGVAVGLTFAFYTLYPARLMREWNVLLVVGWGMLIGGLTLGIVSRVWLSNQWIVFTDFKTLLLMVALIFFGTVAFILFLSSMKYITAVETSILSSIEPLTAMIISVIVFGTSLGFWQLVGVFVMLVCVTWLSIAGEKA
ncbi:EamA family transporter [Lysinibacillus fusiformis]|jgi:drug/metabolite transporter (DMT)-like permease|uniref:DMT family transporter n=1 Tax=Lysinibacillus TaxID=400634 RepID=UPI0004DA4B17|nr:MULTISPECIES: DMT family transporter [Lysinibacillus]AJK89580.1 multidrug transporter [Lysinibacillus fusiformis]KAB0441065.1 EamA family transporter [Lysinibacillus fusiformis]KHK54232.1 multidrug transporter [Lysinibacillus sp. A1]MCE4046200.1 DMT family transporter [Lysinibacillus fusiformis]MCT6816210.1 DMT family transporter [Lysinibacillus fusiformis]